VKRKGSEPVSTTDLPPELARFRFTDWASENDPPDWSPDERYSAMYGRYFGALEHWALTHHLTLEEGIHLTAGTDDATTHELFGGGR
jgi:hypothetical protein